MISNSGEVEFLENGVSKGYGVSTIINYSPSSTFNGVFILNFLDLLNNPLNIVFLVDSTFNLSCNPPKSLRLAGLAAVVGLINAPKSPRLACFIGVTGASCKVSDSVLL